MPNCVLICVLCVIAVRSFPLEEIGKNALALKRVARQNNNYIVQPNLLSTQFYKSSNISALLDTFYENYYGSDEGKGKNVFKNDEDHKSYIENKINFSSKGRNTEENDPATNHKNARESEEDEGEKGSIAAKKGSEKIHNEYESNSGEQHEDLATNISNYLSANSNEDNELFSIEKDHTTNLNEKDAPKSIKISRSSESDEDYEDADEADYKYEIFGNDLDDNETSDDYGSEDFTNEDYNTNEGAESDINDEDIEDKYRTILINELQNRNFQDNNIESTNIINGKHKVSLLPENIGENSILTGSKNVELGDDWWLSASKPYKPSGKRFKFDSKFSKNGISLRDKGKRNFEDNHSVSDSAFGERANGLRLEDGNFNYHDISAHPNFGSNQK